MTHEPMQDYKQIRRRQCSFVHVNSPQVPWGRALHTLWIQSSKNGPSPLPANLAYLSVCLLARSFHICQSSSCALKRVVIRQNNNSNKNSCNNSVQRTFISILKMGRLRSRDRSGWPSSITEERKADLEPVSLDYQFACQSLD